MLRWSLVNRSAAEEDSRFLAKVSEDREVSITKVLRRIKATIKLEIIIFKKDQQDTRVKHVFLNEKGKKIFGEIFDLQKKRIYNALLNSSSEEVINFDNVLSKIIDG